MTGGWPGSSTQCPPGCGLCCENISLSPDAVERIFGPLYLARAEDPEWVNEPTADQPLNPRGMRWLDDAAFIREHFHYQDHVPLPEVSAQYPLDETYVAVQFSCDAFDPNERRCTMYEERPLMCENYPWYGRDPATESITRNPVNDLVCAFQTDVPHRRALPLTVLRG